MCGKPHADLIIRGRMTQADYGIGIYTAPEAARMVGMGAQTLRRWLLGYDHKDKDAQVRHEPALWRPQYDPEERSEEHTSELQSLMRSSYAVFCLKKKQTKKAT